MERFFKRSHIRISIQLKITSRPYTVLRNFVLCVCVCVCVCVSHENIARAARVNFINVWRWPFLILSRTRSTKRPFVNDLSRNCAGRRAPFVPNFFEKIRPAASGWKKNVQLEASWLKFVG